MTRVIRSWLFVVLAIVAYQATLSAQADVASPSGSAAAPAIAPGALEAGAGDARVVLSWRAIEGAAGYRVFRAVDGVWEPEPIASVHDTTYTDTGLANGATYVFAVAAYNAAGTGPQSIGVTATPVAPTKSQGAEAEAVAFSTSSGAPSADQSKKADGEVASPASDARTRTAADRGGAADPTLLVVVPVVAPPASAGTAMPQRRSAATTASEPALATAPPAVAAETAPHVAESTALTAPPPAASTPTETASPAPATAAAEATETAAAAAPTSSPAGLTAAGGDGRVLLSWQPMSGAAGYLVFRATAGVWNASPVAVVGVTTYTNGGLTNGTTYSFRVAAYNDGGPGPQSGDVSALPVSTPTGLKGESGDRQVALSWHASAGAATYTVYRSTSDIDSTFTSLVAGVPALSFLDAGLTNSTRYYYRVRAFAAGGTSDLSAKISVTPLDAPPAVAPAHVVATPGNARIVLTWDAVPGATSYRVFRSTTGSFERLPIATVTTPTFTNTGLTNGTPYAYRIAARTAGGDGPLSPPVSAAPLAPPLAPAALVATGGDRQITLKWVAATGATTYNVYRGTAAGAQTTTPIASGLSIPAFIDTIDNGPSYYYKVTALNVGGESARSAEADAAGEGPPAVVDGPTQAAYRLLQQSTWGPRPGDVDHVKSVGAAAFIDEQLAAPPSAYPDALFTQSIEATQEYFMQLALSGPDQLRQRVAWALHKIWVVSAVEVPSAPAIITYYRLLMGGAVGNYRDLMRAVTLNPAMGRYLNMLNNQSQHVTGVPPNENYARELMQLFTLGLPTLNADGSTVVDSSGMPVPAYTEEDVKELARILSGWTFGDGNPATVPTSLRPENYRVPMEAVPAFHDPAAKFFLGQAFPAHQTAVQDLDQALDALFNHPNLGPFVSRQLIQQLVTSNPSPAYVAAVTAVFNSPGGRGDLAAVVRAILMHPDASAATATSGKLTEPVLFVLAPLRAFGAAVTDHPFMSDRAESMGQKVFFPPSVFSYFSPGYRVRGTAIGGGLPLGGPEFQILTSVTALERANYIGSLLAGSFGDDVVIDLAPFTTRAADPGALVDYCNLVFLGGRMSAEERKVVMAAVRASSTTGNATERVRTALYVTLVIAQSQVDR